MPENYQQGPVSSLRDGDSIVIRQSNGRDMYLPVSVLAAHVADAIKKAHIPANQIDDLPAHLANAIGVALQTAHIPAAQVDGLASVATTGQLSADDVTGLAVVAKTGKYSDLHGKPGDPPGPP